MMDQKVWSCLVLVSRQHLEYYCVNYQKSYHYKVYLVSLTGLISHIATASVVGKLYPLTSSHRRQYHHIYIEQTITGDYLQKYINAKLGYLYILN